MKQLILSYTDALEHYPEQVAIALKSMNAKFRRAKQTPPSPDEMEWSLEWAAGVPDARPPLREVSATFYCCYEKRKTRIPFPEPDRENTGAHLPYHVLAYFDGSVDSSKIRNAGTFYIRNPNGTLDAAIATSGYECDGIIAIHYLILGEPWIEGMNDEDLIEIRGNRAFFEGGLKDVARERFDAAGESGEFTFGSRKMRRLSLDEIKPHIEGKTFTWSLL
jgi:hypothetical protein